MTFISGYKSSWTILHTYLGLKQNETALIVTDTLRLKIAKSLYDTAREMNCEAIMTTMPPRARDGEEPPQAIADAMRSVDVVIAPTTMSLTHTRARKRANEAGVRTATMPGVTERMMVEGGLTANPKDIADNTQKLATILREASEIHLTSEQGTDITFDVDSTKWNLDVGCCRNKGCSTNLPAGELYIAPESSQGTVVIDGSMGGLELLKHPIKIMVKNGTATDIKGDRAKELLKIIAPLGDKARNLAELGIGTNPRARIIGVVLEDEKVCGTAHVALGDNGNFGGTVEAGVHLDGIIRKPRLYADGREVNLLDGCL